MARRASPASTASAWLVLLAMVAVFALLGACTRSPSAAAYTPTPVPTAAVADYLQRYVTALNNRDTSAVAALLNNPGQRQDSADRVAAYGGRGLTIISVELLPEEFPGIVRADVKLRDSGGSIIASQEGMEVRSGVFIMGRMTPQGSAAPASTPPSSRP